MGRNSAYTVKKGVIHSKNGIPEQSQRFYNGRLNFEFDDTGITWIQFMNPMMREGNSTVFYRRLWDGMRYFIEKDFLTYKPDFINCKVWPFGLEAEWELMGVVFRHQIFAVDESIVIRLMTPDEIPEGIHFKFEFYDDFALTPLDTRDFRFHPLGANRKWKEWVYNDNENMLCGGFTNIPTESLTGFRESYLDICIAADFKSEYIVRQVNMKHIMKSHELEPGRTYSYLVNFIYSGEPVKATREKVSGLTQSAAELFARSKKITDRSPRLVSPYKYLNNFISMAPLLHEFAKIIEKPGAIRASNWYYNVWGWDSISCSYSTGYWGDNELIKNLLKFFEESADPAGGIGHIFNYDLTVITPGVLPNQAFYACFLQLYYNFTHDLETVKKHYPFALKLFDMLSASEIRNTGLVPGKSHYPDFPVFMQETGSDISTFNNSIYYCSIRAINFISALLGDAGTVEKSQGIAERIEKSFVNTLFDEEKGFFVGSADEISLKKRKVYHLSSERMENSYLDDIVEPVAKRCMEFMEKNMVSKAGIRETPAWSPSFDGDANQLDCWWPMNSEYFIRTANSLNRRDLIEKFAGYLTYWLKKLTCPEGINCYIETDKPENNRWNALKGVWVISYIRSWYHAIIHGILGVAVEAGGITFYPYDGEEMKLLGMHYREKRLDIEMTGSGEFVESIEVDGEVIRATNKLPEDSINNKRKIKVKIRRTDKRVYPFNIRSGYGIELGNYSFVDNIIRANMKGHGICRLKIGATEIPNVIIDGDEAQVFYDETLKLATIEIVFRDDKCKSLEVRKIYINN